MKKIFFYFLFLLIILNSFSFSIAYAADDKPVDVSGKINVIENKTRYNFLAPLGGIKCMDWGTTNTATDGKPAECISNNIGIYLNFIFKLGIGLCAALAVLMLILNGITYMGDESIFGKTEAKHKMINAVFGLIIALASWAILNTINPDLRGEKGLAVAAVNIDVEQNPLMQNSPYTEGQKTNGCPEGIVTASYGSISIPVCATLKSKAEAMFAAAKSAGINLSGYGYRSTTEQERLRAQNCGGTANIYVAGAVCNPPTALPGKSNHENGLAIDFKCDGAQIRTQTDKCFAWLNTNAITYGYKNLASEPWHWSVDGH